jgi:hypothetical protein
MAIARDGTPTSSNNAAGTSHVINKPSGTANLYCIIGIAFSGSPGTTTPPTGFTEYGPNATQANPKNYAYIKKLDGGEGSTFTVTSTNSIQSGMVCCCYSGVDTTTGNDATPVVSDGVSTNTPAVTGITTVTNNAMLVSTIGVNSGSVTITENDAKVTEVVENSANKKIEMDDGLFVTAGATGNIDYTLSGSRAWAGIVMALRPAAGGAATRKFQRASVLGV